jgi:hypothetical protein
MRFNLEKVRANVRSAATADLLDRATVWRYGMEPEALEVIEAELLNRGVGPSDVEAHAERRASEVLSAPDGHAAICFRCKQPAVERRWVWGRFWLFLPLFPRRAYVCAEHRLVEKGATASPPDRRPPA